MTFSVKLLLFTIALSAVMVSALVDANEKALRLIASTTFLLNVVAAICAAVGPTKSRAIAVGFLLGCLPYVYMVYGNNGIGRRYLASEVALEIVDREFKLSEPRKTPAGETVQVLNNGMVSVTTPRGFGRFRNIVMTWEDAQRLGLMPYAYKEDLLPKKLTFMLIGHMAAALILGIAGGALALWLNKSR